MRFVFALMFLMNVPALSWGMASAPRRPTILLVPSLHSVVQLGRDFVERENVLLMTYAPDTDPAVPYLHAWSGTEWVRIAPELFADGSFLRNSAERVIVVGAANPLTARLIDSSAFWSPEVLNLETVNITELVNSLGRLSNFRAGDWKWFAKRYDLKLEDLNASQRGLSWYDSTKASDLPPPTSPIHRSSREAPNSPSPPHPVLLPQSSAAPLPPASAPAAVPTPAPAETFSFDAK